MENNYLAHRIVFEITKTFDLLEDTFSKHFAKFGLSSVKFKALMQLMLAGEEGLTLSELGEKMDVSRANITGLIDRLEKDDLVYRETDPQDRRVVRARVIPRTAELMRVIVPIHSKFTGSVLAALNTREKEQLLELLEKLRLSLEQ